MKKLLFLDFDGVLHPDGIGLFSNLGLFEQHLLAMPGIEIVISSSWRETQGLDELREYFPLALRDRIIGVTPTLEDGYDRGGRQREIQAFLDAAGLDYRNATWMALDDTALFFEDYYPHLILTDAGKGFSEGDGGKLREWYGGMRVGRMVETDLMLSPGVNASV